MASSQDPIQMNSLSQCKVEKHFCCRGMNQRKASPVEGIFSKNPCPPPVKIVVKLLHLLKSEPSSSPQEFPVLSVGSGRGRGAVGRFSRTTQYNNTHKGNLPLVTKTLNKLTHNNEVYKMLIANQVCFLTKQHPSAINIRRFLQPWESSLRPWEDI